MKKTESKYWLLWTCMLILAACGKSDWEGNTPVNKGGASLILTLKPEETIISTRGIEDLDDDGEVSEEELYVDGRRMYRLGIFLANSEGNVVAKTVLEPGDSRFNNEYTAAEVQINGLAYDQTYTLYAVANYGNYVDENLGLDLTGYLPSITEDNVTGSHVIQATSDNLCDRSLVYPLSLKVEIPVVRGMNTFEGQLLRTYARLRIGVHNTIEEKVTVTGLSFPDNFVQNSANLFFEEWGTTYFAPIVTSDKAITPFQPDVEIPKTDASGDAMGTTIFDAYLLESNGGTYQYTLNLKLGEDGGYQIKGNKTEIRDINNVNGNGKGPFYVICNTLTRKYLYANPITKKVELGDSYGQDGAIDPRYVWEFERTTNVNNNYNFFIESMIIPGHYIYASQADNNPNDIILSNNIDYTYVFTHADDLTFSRDDYYLAVDNGKVYWTKGKLTDPHTIQQFLLYEVESLNEGSGGSVYGQKTIPINIDAIRRNDFVNIVVDLSYK